MIQEEQGGVVSTSVAEMNDEAAYHSKDERKCSSSHPSTTSSPSTVASPLYDIGRQTEESLRHEQLQMIEQLLQSGLASVSDLLLFGFSEDELYMAGVSTLPQTTPAAAGNPTTSRSSSSGRMSSNSPVRCSTATRKRRPGDDRLSPLLRTPTGCSPSLDAMTVAEEPATTGKSVPANSSNEASSMVQRHRRSPMTEADRLAAVHTANSLLRRKPSMRPAASTLSTEGEDLGCVRALQYGGPAEAACETAPSCQLLQGGGDRLSLKNSALSFNGLDVAVAREIASLLCHEKPDDLLTANQHASPHRNSSSSGNCCAVDDRDDEESGMQAFLRLRAQESVE